ncbi:MAG: amidohydrolase family protein, partial [Phycisphaerae bacterium]
VCLTIRVGLGTTGPIGRLGEIKALRAALVAARDYREAWETYDEELETYIKELKAGKTVKLEKKEEKKAAPAPREKPQRRRRPGRRRRRPRPREPVENRTGGPIEEAFIQWLRSPDSFAQAASDQGLKTCEEHPWITFEELCPEDHEDEPNEGDHDEFDPPAIEPPLADDAEKKPPKKEEAGKDKDGEELTKPDQPARDADKEILVKALKRELPVCFEAHRPADILNVLALANEFNLDASISGASGAAYVADELARANVPVILGRLIPAGLFARSHTRDLSLDNASRLAAAGVSLAIGSGRSGGSATHYLSQNAAIAVGHGLNRDQALRAITIQAARLRGAAETIGSLEVGKMADVVIWSGHPLAADSVVERVFIGGVEVYQRGE